MAAQSLRRRVRLLVLELVVPVVLVVAYQWWASRAHDPYFPTLGRITSAFRTMWFGDGFRRHIVPSLGNLAKGYAIGVVGGLLGGLVLGRSPIARRTISPLVSFVLTLPPVALLPLFVVAFGVGAALQIGIIVFAVFFTVLVNAADGLRSVDPMLHDVAAAFRLGRVRRLTHVLLPAAAPQVLAAARAALSLGLLVMVVSELVGASRGIGAATLVAQQSFEYPKMWAGMVLLAIIGYVLNRLFALVERPLLHRLGVGAEVDPGSAS